MMKLEQPDRHTYSRITPWAWPVVLATPHGHGPYCIKDSPWAWPVLLPIQPWAWPVARSHLPWAWPVY